MTHSLRFLAAAALAAAMAAGPPAPLRADDWDELVGQDTLKRIAAAAPSTAAPKGKQPRKVLVLTESKRDLDAAARSQGMKFVPHRSAPHCAKAVAIVGKQTGAYEATITSDLGAISADGLKPFDAIVLANVYLEGKLYRVPRDAKQPGRSPFEERQKALVEFVRGGKGLVGIHNATAEALGWVEFNRMIGGTHRGHAWHAHQTVPIRLDDPKSPLNAAFEGRGFSIRDDVYLLAGPYARDAVHVLLSVDAAKAPASMTAERADGDYPISWVRTYGRGRVFYTALGDSPATFENAKFLRHLLSGIRFALGDLQADTSPGKPLARKAGFTTMEGWTALFDGKDLDAWKLDEQQKPHWLVEDGIIRYDGRGKTLWTRESFKDFMLRVDWRLPRKADSGVFLRGSGKAQINIWTWSMGSGELWSYRGGAKTDELRKSYTPKLNADKAVGEWNTFLVTMKGDRLTVSVNGREVISQAHLKGIPAEGPIALQQHGDPIEFKSIYVKPLPSEPK